MVTLVKLQTTSGRKYSEGFPISYKNCSATVPKVTIPPVFSGLVTMKSPLGLTSTIGNPISSKPSIIFQSVKFPPVH